MLESALVAGGTCVLYETSYTHCCQVTSSPFCFSASDCFFLGGEYYVQYFTFVSAELCLVGLCPTIKAVRNVLNPDSSSLYSFM